MTPSLNAASVQAIGTLNIVAKMASRDSCYIDLNEGRMMLEPEEVICMEVDASREHPTVNSDFGEMMYFYFRIHLNSIGFLAIAPKYSNSSSTKAKKVLEELEGIVKSSVTDNLLLDGCGESMEVLYLRSNFSLLVMECVEEE